MRWPTSSRRSRAATAGPTTGLPRVGAFEVWNEVNASFFFMPQKDGSGRPVSPELYRDMVNAVAAGVHSVHPDNLVIAGGLFPFRIERPSAQTIAPLRFMRQLLCMSKKLVPKANCGPPVAFDVWSHHPYTEGSPTHASGNPTSISISGLQRMGDLLRAAVRARARSVERCRSSTGSRSGPGTATRPTRGRARGAARPLGVGGAVPDVVRRGQPCVLVLPARRRRAGREVPVRPLHPLRGGVYCDRPKLALQAFRFPFVALRQRRKVRIWGRTPPSSTTTTVVIERSARRAVGAGRLDPR